MRVLIITVAVVAVLVGLGFVCPALAAWRTQGGLEFGQSALLTLGSAMTLAGVGGIAAAAVGKRR